MTHVLALGMPGMAEWLIIGALGLLIFGKRLPEVGKGLGQAISNFKLGMKEGETTTMVDDDAGRTALAQTDYKFDPQTGKPVERPSP